MTTTEYRILALRPAGWETVATRTKSASAKAIFERFVTGAVVPTDYAAVRVETPTGRVIHTATVDSTDLVLTDAQCAGLAELLGQGDLVAEIEADLARRAAEEKPEPAPALRARRATPGRAAYVTLSGDLAGIRAYTGTLYVVAHRVDAGWKVLGVTDEKARGLKLLERSRTDAVVAESLTTSAGREVHHAEFALISA